MQRDAENWWKAKGEVASMNAALDAVLPPAGQPSARAAEWERRHDPALLRSLRWHDPRTASTATAGALVSLLSSIFMHRKFRTFATIRQPR